MNHQETGGPAFPNTWFDRDSTGQMVSREHYEGMALRDYFAAKAMAALIEKTGTAMADEAMRTLGYGPGETDKLVAKCAYDYADAMLAAREQRARA